MDELIWYKDVRTLFKHPTLFWPTRDQSLAGQINALVRLIFYATAAIYVYTWEERWIAYGLGMIVLVSLGYKNAPNESKGPKKGSFAHLAPLRCRKPTPDNPFMNTKLTEYGKDPLPPCNYDDVKDQVKEYFNNGLPRNIEDLYEKENSQREFIPMPNGGVPPDTRTFAEFLYGDMRNCKNNARQCI